MKLIIITIAAMLLAGCGTTTAMLIHKAAFDGNIKAVKRHLNAGVDANAQTRSENTPLHAAAYQGHSDVVELLIANGADVNASDVRGWIPLHAAVDQGHAAVADLLIVKGADLNARMKGGGYTVLDLANLKEQTEIALLLRKHGAKTGEELKAEGK
ncbi:MAG: ankyrin repeat domain-containing protein [Pedosphaera sp.]|nr:ankyrin repeat domain-containing protein [Pedosphaera sp.]